MVLLVLNLSTRFRHGQNQILPCRNPKFRKESTQNKTKQNKIQTCQIQLTKPIQTTLDAQGWVHDAADESRFSYTFVLILMQWPALPAEGWSAVGIMDWADRAIGSSGMEYSVFGSTFSTTTKKIEIFTFKIIILTGISQRA